MLIYVDGGVFFSGKIKDLQILLARLQQEQITLSQFIKQKLN